MSFAPPENDQNKFREGRDILSEMQARDMLELDNDSQPVDFLGPLFRRKSIVILFCLIGLAIGYLLFRQELPTYQSGLRIMIWKKTPPSIVNGEKFEQGVSLQKEQTLIASQEVLDSAIERSKLAELETFRGHPAPFFALRKMISVKPVSNSSDTLELTCRGPIADDLPVILNAIVESYMRSISDDRLSTAQDSIALIDKVIQQASEDSAKAKKRYYELMEKLGLSAESDVNDIRNPFLDRLNQLEQEKLDREKALVRVRENLNGVMNVIRQAPNIPIEVMQSLTIEAEKYLNLGTHYGASSTMAMEKAGADAYIHKLRERVDALESDISAAELKRKKYGRQLGDSHPSSVIIQLDLEALISKRDAVEQELKVLREQQELESEKDKDTQQKTAKAANNGVNESSIRIYHAHLQREQAQHEGAIKQLADQISQMETQAALIKADIADVNYLKNFIKERAASERENLERLSEISLVAANFSTTRVRTIDQAQKGAIISPILRNYLLFSLLIGGLLGSALAILIDRADLTFRNPYEIFQKMKVPVICKIPTISKTKQKNNLGCVSTLITALDPRSSGAEAFRACRTALLFFSNHSGAKVYLMSSPSAGDGKSTAVANLAVSMAQGGKRVVILDADMRRPRQHKYFGMSMKPGMVDFADGNSTLDDIIRPTFQENLCLVACGGHPNNPGEFVVSPKFKEILQGLRDRFDVILIDSPPLLPVADATSLSTQVDGVLLVFRIRKGVVLASQKARELLDLVHARMLGILVNGVDQNPYYNEYGGYGYPSQAGYYASRYYEKQTKEYAEAGEAS